MVTLVYSSTDGHNSFDPDDCNCAQCEHDYIYHGFKMDDYCYTCADTECPNYDPNAFTDYDSEED